MRLFSLLVVLASIAACTSASRESSPPALLLAAMPAAAAPMDYSAIRGANYCAAYGNHNDHWNRYDPKETSRDLDYAKKININQVRVFLSYPAYAADKEKFKKNLVDLAKQCQARGIGLMPVVPSSAQMNSEAAPYPLSREWVQVLLDTIGKEPALAFWDAANEPDLPQNVQTKNARIAHARVMAGLFREMDTRQPRTPVTIGFAAERYMEENGDVVDVLAFHDYLTTRELIRKNIANAKAYAAKVNKPLINTEIGCTGRANPYDVCIEEYANAGVGFYMWELMITGQWGTIHGIFYPDGTIRDPAVPAAMMGLYRNRSENIVMEVPDREGRVTRAVSEGKAWLSDANGTYEEGLRQAEVAANLLEANELVSMRDLPSRHVMMLQKGPQDMAGLRALVTEFVRELEPFELPAGAPARGRGPVYVPGSGQTQPATGPGAGR
jgi:hypothetical protein